MKNVLAILVLLATIAVAAPAQTFIADPSATLIGTFPVQIGITRNASGEPILTKANPHTIVAIGTFRTQSGMVVYQILTPTIDFNGTDGALIDDVTTSMLYTWLAQAGVAEGTRLGYTSAPGCPAVATQRMFAEACVVRTGSGVNTAFQACYGGAGQFTVWQFDACQPSSGDLSVVLQNVHVNAQPCETPCQPTWVGQGGEGANQLQ